MPELTTEHISASGPDAGHIKRFLQHAVSVVLFFLVGSILFFSVQEVFRRKTCGASDMVHSFYYVEKNTLDVLVLGSSHGYYSYEPNELWGKYGLASYCMCCPQQSLMESYYLLKEALEYQNPKVVLLESYYMFFTRKHTGSAKLRMAFDGIRLSPRKWEMLQDALEGVDWKDKVSYFFPFFKYHTRSGDLRSYDFHVNNYLKGSTLTYTKANVTEYGLPSAEDVHTLPAVSQRYLNKIIDLCREKGCELVVYASPYSTGKADYDYYMLKQSYNYWAEEYLEGQGIPYLFFQRDGLGDGIEPIDYATDFNDSAHLNSYGAEKITEALGKYLTEHYELPGHKDDEAYSSWETDYRRYLRKTKKMKKK